MKLREILQIELWSKQTSRKIVITILIVFVMVWVAEKSRETVFRNWLTPGERTAAIEALSSLDELKQMRDPGGDVFRAKLVKAKDQVQVAESAAWTIRDHKVSLDLSTCLLRALGDRMVKIKSTSGSSTDSEGMLKLREFVNRVDDGTCGLRLHKELER